MQIIRGREPVAPALRGASAAMGNFDGVHRGHQAVIDLARPHGPLGVVTFEPHPRSFFAPDAPAFRLTSEAGRARRLQQVGVERLFVLPFDADLAGLTAEAFARDLLAGALGLGHVVVGADFRFGAKRVGDVEMLRDLGAAHGFGVTVAEMTGEGEVFSSTAVRAALSAGDPAEAARILGDWHRVDGPVAHGHKRGRELGFPTANLTMEGLHIPKFGIYAAITEVLTGPHAGVYHSAVSIGERPTFGGFAPNLESYLFDFSGDIYGEHISVALVGYLRGEEKFDGIDPLITQMNADCDRARAMLARL